MPLAISCPACKSAFKADAHHVGKQGKCPKCGSAVPIVAGSSLAPTFLPQLDPVDPLSVWPTAQDVSVPPPPSPPLQPEPSIVRTDSNADWQVAAVLLLGMLLATVFVAMNASSFVVVALAFAFVGTAILLGLKPSWRKRFFGAVRVDEAPQQFVLLGGAVAMLPLILFLMSEREDARKSRNLTLARQAIPSAPNSLSTMPFQSPPQSYPQRETIVPRPTTELILEHWSYGEDHGFVTAEGEVTNNTGGSLSNVTAVVTFVAVDKTFVKSSEALISYNPVLAGQSSPFKVIDTWNPAIKSARITFKHLLGGTINFKSRKELKQSTQNDPDNQQATPEFTDPLNRYFDEAMALAKYCATAPDSATYERKHRILATLFAKIPSKPPKGFHTIYADAEDILDELKDGTFWAKQAEESHNAGKVELARECIAENRKTGRLQQARIARLKTTISERE